ncbi:MAG: hypothetical protein RL348_1734 [Bacteroidota bacterium]|jgi:hypothetical protein
MIPVKLTTTNGESKTINLPNRETVETFITAFSTSLPLGIAVNIDAPLIGIHHGWLFGKKQDPV